MADSESMVQGRDLCEDWERWSKSAVQFRLPLRPRGLFSVPYFKLAGESYILYSVGICWRPGKSCFFPVLLFLATILFVPFEIFLLIELYPRLEEPVAFERKKMAFLVIIRRFNRRGKAKKPRSLAKNFLAVILLTGTVSVSFVSVYFSDDIFALSRTFKFSLIQGEEIWHRKTLWKGYWLRLITGQSGARSMCNALRMG